MASRDATINKRVEAVERIKRSLPGLTLKPFPAAGPEFQHAADLEAIADALEAGAARQVEKPTANKGD